VSNPRAHTPVVHAENPGEWAQLDQENGVERGEIEGAVPVRGRGMRLAAGTDSQRVEQDRDGCRNHRFVHIQG